MSRELSLSPIINLDELSDYGYTPSHIAEVIAQETAILPLDVQKQFNADQARFMATLWSESDRTESEEAIEKPSDVYGQSIPIHGHSGSNHIAFDEDGKPYYDC